MELVLVIFGAAILGIFCDRVCIHIKNSERDLEIKELEKAIFKYSDYRTVRVSKLEMIEERLDNLPQNRAKVALDKLEEVKQIMDELEGQFQPRKRRNN